MNKHVNDLLKKEVSRKEFLATIGVGTAAVLGLSTALRFMGINLPNQRQTNKGYGTSVYGGSRRDVQTSSS